VLVLAFDTAGPNCAVALALGEARSFEVITHAEERVGRGHADRLMPMIEAVIRDAGLAFADLQRIAVTTGPGSFTGVRVGIAAARALALALDIPAIGIGSLSALVHPLMRDHDAGTAVALLDARRGEVYAFAEDIGSRRVAIPSSAASPEDVAARLAAATLPILLTGAGAPILAPILPAARVVDSPDAPDIADVAALGLAALPDVPPVPVYARGADAKPQSAKAVHRR
jgi:tRNA threonylcarbamoyl adenosine modification protein YeaZ